PIGLGTQAQNAGITISGNINVDAKMTSDLKVGVDTTATHEHAFLDGNSTVQFSIDADAKNFTANVEFGFLDASTSPNNEIKLEGRVPITFAAGENPLGTAPTSLTSLSANAGPVFGSGFSVNLPITLSDTGVLSGFSSPNLTGTVDINALF